MSLDAFIHYLHYDTDKARPPDWEVDWEDAPLPYKLYRGLPVVSLCPEVPLTLEGGRGWGKPDIRRIAHFLWYVFGLTQVCQSVIPLDSTEHAVGSMPFKRRFVPSGGGLYPNELYVYLKLEDLPQGVYHYDVAHHQLILLREGDFDSYLARALGSRCDVSACFGAVFVSTLFWKNFFKYHNFGYRLQGLDAGVLIGQLLEVAKRFGISSGVYFQFLDLAVNHLLGITEQEESVYAVIPLSAAPEITWFANRRDDDAMVSAAELCRELPVVQHQHYVRSQRVREYPMLIRMNEVSLLDSPHSFRRIVGEKKAAEAGPVQAVILPSVNRLSYDLAPVCRKRYSPEMDFVMGRISEPNLAALLQEAAKSFLYRNDLDGACENPVPRVRLYCCLRGVEGIPDGAYRYDSTHHLLRQVRPGDHRLRLQQGMSLDNVNLYQVPLSLHVAGDKDHLLTLLGYRGYRIQQMEAGMLVQRLLLAAFAMGMGGHPLLGYDVNLCDEIYHMARHGQTSLIQVPVGPYRDRPRLSGGLHG
ncbi:MULTISPECIES: SagB family peptide dehydrogenase [unclassified Paenibacillus]|uniref:SagB family peptide dehydrogenase n=1 Tax=unclassified Paenibacillus TaxID=185978 RepID=UPI001AE4F9F6|nr:MULTISPECIES: SagB family peptide dehydrogenase [unclassified Paenibacillus]MBP1157421.1 SagB-type dehydrogenase family enzyme [Paenibacillus sp. PvP091]MBP1171841.1 SagB-type dehydrogenase family enzyme [Paenibacillus sp. PvR098]MBP2438222.1 SagB-type dehydrogenase family enzyme [Paenibacillus sp. PvP052]